MSKKFFYVLIIAIFAVAFTAQAGEKVGNFKFKYYGPHDHRVYLVGENGGISSGHYSLRPMISYSANNYIYSGLGFSTGSVDDKTSAIYNGKVDTKDILNLTSLYYTYNTFMIATIVGASLGLGGIIAGAAIMSYSSTPDTQYNQVVDFYDWMGSPVYKTETVTTYPHEYLLTPGMISLIAGGSLFVISAAVFLPIFLYNFIVYGRVKKEILGLLNGFEVSNSAGNNLFRFKFDLVLG